MKSCGFWGRECRRFVMYFKVSNSTLKFRTFYPIKKINLKLSFTQTMSMTDSGRSYFSYNSPIVNLTTMPQFQFDVRISNSDYDQQIERPPIEPHSNISEHRTVSYFSLFELNCHLSSTPRCIDECEKYHVESRTWEFVFKIASDNLICGEKSLRINLRKSCTIFARFCRPIGCCDICLAYTDSLKISTWTFDNSLTAK